MREFSRGTGVLVAASFALLLSACASHGSRQVARAPARQTAAYARPVVQPYPAHRPTYAAPVANARSSETVLRLRAGLNVAALSCRGRGMPAVTPAYGRVLTRHSALLASAYRTETQRLGQAGLDRQQTRIYNRFANQQSPGNFCRSAAYLAAEASAMDSARLASASSGMVAQLESQLR